MAALGVSGYVLWRWTAMASLLGARYKRLEELADDLDLKAWERRYKSLAAEVEDVLERESRLSDRIRKRAKVDHTPAEDVPNGEAFSARVNGVSHVVSVQELMRRSGR